MRQRNAVVSVIGVIILIGLIAFCVLFGNNTTDETSDIEIVTVADRLVSIWQNDKSDANLFESKTVLKSYYGSLTEPLDGSLATFNVCENNELIIFLSEYGSYMGFTIDNEYIYYDDTIIFEISEMTDGVLMLLPVHREEIHENAYYVVADGEAETFVADMT